MLDVLYMAGTQHTPDLRRGVINVKQQTSIIPYCTIKDELTAAFSVFLRRVRIELYPPLGFGQGSSRYAIQRT